MASRRGVVRRSYDPVTVVTRVRIPEDATRLPAFAATQSPLSPGVVVLVRVSDPIESASEHSSDDVRSQEMSPVISWGWSSRQAALADTLVLHCRRAGPRRVWNLHDPMCHSRPLARSKHAPDATGSSSERSLHPHRVRRCTDIQLILGRWSSGRRSVPWVHGTEVRILVDPSGSSRRENRDWSEDSGPARRSME